MKKINVFIIVFFLLSGFSFAQDYKGAIGFRGGVDQGLTLKNFVGGSNAFDLILSTHHYGLHFTALYEKHVFDIFDVPNLALFYGFGGHIGFYNSTRWPSYWPDHTGSATVIGADLVIGVEYTFKEIPINIALDVVPSLNILPYTFYWQKGALSIRYVFK